MKRTMQKTNYIGYPDLTPLGILYAPRKEFGAPAISNAPYEFSVLATPVAQIFNLPYRRFVIGRTLLAGDIRQVKNLRYSTARRSRNQRSAGL